MIPGIVDSFARNQIIIEPPPVSNMWDDVTIQMVAERFNITSTGSQVMAVHGAFPNMINGTGRIIASTNPPSGHTKYFEGTTAFLGTGLITSFSEGNLVTPAATEMFNLEAWFFNTGVACAIFGYFATLTDCPWQLRWYSNTNLALRYQLLNGSVVEHIFTTVSMNAWYYIALSRDATGLIRLFVNGVFAGSVSVPEFYVSDNRRFIVASADAGVTSGVLINWTNFRYLKGTCLYNSDAGHAIPGPFVSGKPLIGDPFWNDVILLLQDDMRTENDAISIFSQADFVVSRSPPGSQTIITDTVKFTRFARRITASTAATGSITGIPDNNALNLNGSGLTVEFWFRYDALRTNIAHVGGASHYRTSGNNRSWSIGFEIVGGSVKARAIASVDGVAATILVGNTSLVINTWYYLTLSFDSETKIIRLFVDGILENKNTLSGNFFNLVDTPIDLFHWNNGTTWAGSIYGPVRITKACRYNTDDSFAVPTDRFPTFGYWE